MKKKTNKKRRNHLVARHLKYQGFLRESRKKFGRKEFRSTKENSGSKEGGMRPFIER